MSDITLPTKNEIPAPTVSILAAKIKEDWRISRDARLSDERRWLKAFRNYRGEYDAETLSRIEADSSRVFVKFTKAKVISAYGQILDIMFARNKFPLSIDPTPKPLGVAERAYLDEQGSGLTTDEALDPYGYEGDGKSLPPGATHSSLLGGLEKSLGQLSWKEGKSPAPGQIPQVKPAEETAKKMQKLIEDQLEESKTINELKKSIFEMALLGTGIIKGPFAYQKTYHNWTDGQYDPKIRMVPDNKHVTCWAFYPDPHGKTVEDLDYCVERHKLNRAQLRALRKRPLFDEEAILEAINRGPNHDLNREWWETYIKDSQTADIADNRYTVLEYWGTIDKVLISEMEIDKFLDRVKLEELEELDEVQINAWLCNDVIIRLTLNPFTPAKLPYFACPYEQHPYQFFGIGIPENMEDTQSIINGHARMAIDNLRLSGNVMIEVDETLLEPGQDFKIKAGKIWRRNGGQPGQSIHSIKIDSTTAENIQMIDKFRQFADEQTGISSLSQGVPGYQTGVRTASQTSMLLSAAALTIKTVINNVDDYLIKPLGDSMFAWNMQFNTEEMPEIKGDLEIKATGTSSLMQKEVKSQRVMQFMQVAGSNPMLAPMVKWHIILADLAETLDIDPEDVINDPEEAAVYARIMGMLQGGAGIPQEGQSTAIPGQQQSPDLSSNGGGTIGTPAPQNPAGNNAAPM